MNISLASLTALSVVVFSSYAGAATPPQDVSSSTVPVHAVTSEPGVLPIGTTLVVQTNDQVKTDRAYQATLYTGTVAQAVVDQSGKVLIPKGAPVDLTVRARSSLGPGGVGMTQLRLVVEEIGVKGVSYPVATTQAMEDRTEGVKQVTTEGRRINVPARTQLTFELQDPLRLQGYREQ